MDNSVVLHKDQGLSIAQYQHIGPNNILEIVNKNSEIVKQKVEHLESVYYKIDISLAMNNLSNVGKVLQLAYASSKGFSCSTSVVSILSDYQTLVINSEITSGSFVEGCVSAIKIHQLASKFVTENKIELAWKFMQKCSEIAKKMIDESGKLVNQSEKLCELSREGLLKAVTDYNDSSTKQKEVQKELNETREKEEKLKVATKLLQEELIEEKEKEERIGKKVGFFQNLQIATSFISTLAKPLTKTLSVITKIIDPVMKNLKDSSDPTESTQKELKEKNNKINDIEKEIIEQKSKIEKLKIKLRKSESEVVKNEIEEVEIYIKELKMKKENEKKQIDELTESLNKINEQCTSTLQKLEDQETKIIERRIDLQKEYRTQNSSLVESIEKLKNLKVDQNGLDVAVQSLDVAQKALGKIKVTFEHVRQFWTCVYKHCEKLKDVQVLEMLGQSGEVEMFSNELQDSVWGWLVLGKINIKAQQLIGNVSQGVSKIVSDLPSKEEAKIIMNTVPEKMILDLSQEDLARKIENNENQKWEKNN